MADNFIKPYILHGQSNLHPLVALLSVLGGVTALGPIGLLIGPMVVVFLQTLLKILQRELRTMEGNELAIAGLAASIDAGDDAGTESAATSKPVEVSNLVAKDEDAAEPEPDDSSSSKD